MYKRQLESGRQWFQRSLQDLRHRQNASALTVEIRDVSGNDTALQIDRVLVLLRNRLVDPVRALWILGRGVGPGHVHLRNLGARESAVQTVLAEVDVATVGLVNAHARTQSVRLYFDRSAAVNFAHGNEIAKSNFGFLAAHHGERLEFALDIHGAIPALVHVYRFPGCFNLDCNRGTVWLVLNIVTALSGVEANLGRYDFLGFSTLLFCLGRIFFLSLLDIISRDLGAFDQRAVLARPVFVLNPLETFGAT